MLSLHQVEWKKTKFLYNTLATEIWPADDETCDPALKGQPLLKDASSDDVDVEF